MKIKIANRWIGKDFPVFIIAEGGINHNGSVKIAKKLIEKAVDAGADAIKFQTFTADDLTSPKSKFYETFKKLELSFDDFSELKDHAKKQDIMFLSTPFSFEAVDMLDRLKVPAFKIASGDLTHIPLIKHIALKNKPIIISTGMANMTEVKYAVKTIEATGNKKIIILHSSSTYPTPPEEANLNAIQSMEHQFSYPIGYSDNGNDMLVPLIAISLGAKLIEKHFTLNRSSNGPDHIVSLDPTLFTNLVRNIRHVEKILGNGIKKCQPSEMENKIEARRSLTAKISLEPGSKILEKSIGFKRPAKGIEPQFINKVIGKKVIRQINVGESIKWKYLK